MTDEEMKRLEELATEAERKRCGGYWPDDMRRLHGALWPKDVLALIERVRKAERKGAEEMRERLRERAFAMRDEGEFSLEEWGGVRRVVEDVALEIQVPGDEPDDIHWRMALSDP